MMRVLSENGNDKSPVDATSVLTLTIEILGRQHLNLVTWKNCSVQISKRLYAVINYNKLITLLIAVLVIRYLSTL